MPQEPVSSVATVTFSLTLLSNNRMCLSERGYRILPGKEAEFYDADWWIEEGEDVEALAYRLWAEMEERI